MLPLLLLLASLPLAADLANAVTLFQGEYALYVSLGSSNPELILPLPTDDVEQLAGRSQTVYVVIRVSQVDPLQGAQPRLRVRIVSHGGTVYSSPWFTATPGTIEVPLQSNVLVEGLREHGQLSMVVELDRSRRPSWYDRSYGVTITMVALAPANGNTHTVEAAMPGAPAPPALHDYAVYIAAGAGALALASLIIAAAKR